MKLVPAVAQPPQDRPPDAAAATNADTVAFRSTSNSSAMIVSIPARARMRPAHQLARAQHQLAGRDVGAPDPLLNSAAVERRLRRAVQRGKITGTGHIWGRCRPHMKRILKLDRVRLRGLSGAKDEVLLTATAQNLRRLAKLLCRAPPPVAAVCLA